MRLQAPYSGVKVDASSENAKKLLAAGFSEIKAKKPKKKGE